jgi:protein involved in polysaccharide export with SLBB domain
LKEGDMIIVPLKPEVKEVVVEVKIYTVMGHVKSPGVYPLPKSGQMDILSAIAKAGGETPLARLSKVKVLRKEGATSRPFPANVEKMQKGEEAPFIILPNDIITVPESIF